MSSLEIKVITYWIDKELKKAFCIFEHKRENDIKWIIAESEYNGKH